MNIILNNKYIIVIRNDESNSFLWNRMEQEGCLLCVYGVAVTPSALKTDALLYIVPSPIPCFDNNELKVLE